MTNREKEIKFWRKAKRIIIKGYGADCATSDLSEFYVNWEENYPIPQPPAEGEKWEKEFESEFISYDCDIANGRPCHLERYHETIKSFIRKAIQAAREEGRWEAESVIKEKLKQSS